MDKKTQKEVVLELIKSLAPVRTEVLKREALYKGISCPDRYARYLKNEGEIFSYKLAGDKTYTWAVMGKNIFSGIADKVYQSDEKGQLLLGVET